MKGTSKFNVGIICLSLLVLAYLGLRNPYKVPFVKTQMFAEKNRQYVADSKRGYVTATNFSGYSDLTIYTEIHYDHLGARVNSAEDRTPDEIDLMVVGCSQAWGQGVANQETFTQVISSLTSSKVANFAVSSYGGVESFLTIKQHLKLKPKYVIYAFWEDHFNRNLILCNQTSPVCVERPIVYNDNKELKIRYPKYSDLTLATNQRWYSELADYHNTGKYSLLKSNFWHVASTMEYVHNLTNQMDGLRKQIFGKGIDNEDKIEAAKYVLEQMYTAVSAAGAELIVLYIPYYGDAPNAFTSQMPSEISRFLGDRDIKFINLEYDFKLMNANNIPISIPKDGHINKRVHKLIAGHIAKVIS